MPGLLLMRGSGMSSGFGSVFLFLIFIIISFIIFIFAVTFVHANLCLHILASTCQDGGNPFPVIRLPVLNGVTDSSRHTLLLLALHSQWSRQVYIIHRSITGFLVVQKTTRTHAHEYRLLGASCYVHHVHHHKLEFKFSDYNKSAKLTMSSRPKGI